MNANNIIITTSENIPGRTIKAVAGLVHAEGEDFDYAINILKLQATTSQADAIIALRHSITTYVTKAAYDNTSYSHQFYSLSGTAVTLEKEAEKTVAVKQIPVLSNYNKLFFPTSITVQKDFITLYTRIFKYVKGFKFYIETENMFHEMSCSPEYEVTSIQANGYGISSDTFKKCDLDLLNAETVRIIVTKVVSVNEVLEIEHGDTFYQYDYAAPVEEDSSEAADSSSDDLSLINGLVIDSAETAADIMKQLDVIHPTVADPALGYVHRELNPILKKEEESGVSMKDEFLVKFRELDKQYVTHKKYPKVKTSSNPFNVICSLCGTEQSKSRSICSNCGVQLTK